MQQRISGSFRQDPATGFLNLLDAGAAGPPPGSSARTLGATIIDQVTFNVPLLQRWEIIGWEIAFNAGILVQTGFKLYGQLGRIYAGLCRQTQTAGPAVQPTNVWQTPMAPLPSDDFSSITLAWDGSTDPAFPQTTSATPSGLAASPVLVQTQLPQSKTVRAGESLAIGIWLTPSLITNVAQIFIYQARYLIFYDDGRPAR